MEYGQIVDRLQEFFSKNTIVNKARSFKNIEPFSYWDELLIVSAEYPSRKDVYVEFRHLETFNQELADKLLSNPTEWFMAATDAISEIEFPINNLPDITVRVIDLPQTSEVMISKLRNDHLEKFITIRCVISKATEVRPAYETVAYKCLRCGHVTRVTLSKDYDQLEEPFAGCENDTCGKRGPYDIVNEGSIRYDHQYLKIQEPIENLRGRQPETLNVSCSDELAGSRKPGEKVIITGTLKSRIQTKKEGKTKFLDFLFVANSIQLSDKDYENLEITPHDEEQIKELAQRPDIKQVVISSIAPSIRGHENIKEGIVLQLFSGNSTNMSDGTHIRKDIHILIIGDPGVGKSQILSFVSNFAPRAIQVSGGSTSAAGLTGAAVRDEFDGRWSIEAGALTMAGDGGICCVDELDKMNNKDRGSMHDALEQQYVNVAKAGVFAKLPTACSLLGAANPKYGRYDQYESIFSQFNIGDALLSRMDLIFVFRDIPNAENDSALAWHILDEGNTNYPERIDLELLRKYIAYSKIYCSPKMTEEAKACLVDFFLKTREKAGSIKDSVPVTVRTLESAKRLAVANAKIRLSETVEKKDALDAITLLLRNLHEVGIDPETGDLDASYLECGVSGSQRQKIKLMKEIIQKLCKQNLINGTAKIDDIERECEKNKIVDPIAILSKLKSRGDIVAITPDSFKIV
ncbi:hypothetical protein EO98_04765 [Methanosarcina sp. 2.H.T.1A.6]|uniref:minichromosome maintenance protein MCM n=1 Tax=unclassified Methanosarcina TaxID=2644672 RepID=UPI000622261F|nr:MULTISPECIES: minichromosome maintenance protein MCM [unclassified Methanosarcina]KKG16014.1 hypothetical protein EO94_05205 [Methanosarcina sp. 2.H.T.1A.3]KKG21295.1 hypothetical protein EO98_04765 [Methanosarcina sp. 2.H.T.1A.6]KKG24137.1 hypothetical protein EO96_14160 [Methanosarcina sp. 2.H.T.1A.8]KKG28686.1 hypothetical protein EO97_14850 [Methanosarcina sp. 2.H.T.1A.15]